MSKAMTKRGLKVKHEPSNTLVSGVMENCCLCREPTRFWFVKKDVALCEACAEAATEEDLPSKAEWCAKERQLSKTFGW